MSHRIVALGVAAALATAVAPSPVDAGESPYEELSSLRSADADLEAELDALETWLLDGKVRLEELDAGIEQTEIELDEAERAVVRAQRVVDRQTAAVQDRAVAAYIHPSGEAAVTFAADDVNKAAEQRLLVRQVAEYDRELLDAKLRTERRLDEQRDEAERKRANLAARRDEVTALLDRLNEQQAEAETARRALDARIKAVRAEVDAMAAAQGGLADLINDLSDFEGEPVGRLIVPTDGILTSRYGPRWGRLHAGIDLAAPTGTAIWAAAPGRTIFSGWMGGYGNAVVVDHGNGLTTLYAHQSRRRTVVGDILKRGQVLGEVGSTGNSTGAHLHFEVRERGAAVDPIPYLRS